MNAKIEEIKNQAFNTFGYQGIDDSLNRFAGQLLAEHTKFMQEKLIAWLGHQVYSGNSHRTFDMGFEKSPDMDEDEWEALKNKHAGFAVLYPVN